MHVSLTFRYSRKAASARKATLVKDGDTTCVAMGCLYVIVYSGAVALVMEELRFASMTLGYYL